MRTEVARKTERARRSRPFRFNVAESRNERLSGDRFGDGKSIISNGFKKRLQTLASVQNALREKFRLTIKVGKEKGFGRVAEDRPRTATRRARAIFFDEADDVFCRVTDKNADFVREFFDGEALVKRSKKRF